MAEGGILPRKLLQAEIPMYPACQYGQMHRRPWHSKGQVASNIKVIQQPGQTVSVDQLESKTPGFIAELKGLLAQERY